MPDRLAIIGAPSSAGAYAPGQEKAPTALREIGLAELLSARGIPVDPAGAAEAVVRGWARQYDRLLVHLDLDVLDFADMPLAENTRRNVGLRFHHLVASLRSFLGAPNWAALTIAELNPDHGESDGSTLRTFAEALADALAVSPRWRSS